MNSSISYTHAGVRETSGREEERGIKFSLPRALARKSEEEKYRDLRDGEEDISCEDRERHKRDD